MGLMICQSCGYANLDDVSFCSACGAVFDPRSGKLTSRKTGSDPSRSVLHNKASSSHSRSKALEMSAAGFAAPTGAGHEGAFTFLSLLENPDEGTPPEEMRLRGAEEDEKPISAREESLLAKLDRMEEHITSRFSDANTSFDTEEEDAVLGSEWGTKEHNLVSMSSSLDELIADLLDAEINEYLTPDFIHPDETGFPSPQPNFDVKKRKNSKQYVVDALVIIALVIAVFLVGMTVGLWGSQTFGL